MDPATGELYYMSHITSASLWEKRNETLRSEAELRRLVVPRLDNEFRGEVRACVRFACVWTHMCLWAGMGGECGWEWAAMGVGVGVGGFSTIEGRTLYNCFSR